MIKTFIQWCHSTVNPIMGCGGCELFPSPGEVLGKIDRGLATVVGWSEGMARMIFKKLISDAFAAIEDPERGHSAAVTTTNIWHLRKKFAELVASLHGRKAGCIAAMVVAEAVKCYAGRITLNKGTSIENPDRKANRGYAPVFESVTRFHGRVWEMARARDLRGVPNPDKPWLDGCRRLIFVSDMGDAFSRDSDFEFLEEEVIAPIRSPQGQRHFWLWLTKRPERMARFGNRIGGFPANVCAMTTITCTGTLHRVNDLRRVSAAVRGLSIEPLCERISAKSLDLTGIAWVIVGGESGRYDAVRPFDLSWARELRDLCHSSGVAFFCKQLGRRPFDANTELRLMDKHGGDWSEWPEDLRVREVPAAFKAGAS